MIISSYVLLTISGNLANFWISKGRSLHCTQSKCRDEGWEIWNALPEKYENLQWRNMKGVKCNLRSTCNKHKTFPILTLSLSLTPTSALTQDINIKNTNIYYKDVFIKKFVCFQKYSVGAWLWKLFLCCWKLTWHIQVRPSYSHQYNFFTNKSIIIINIVVFTIMKMIIWDGEKSNGEKSGRKTWWNKLANCGKLKKNHKLWQNLHKSPKWC